MGFFATLKVHVLNYVPEFETTNSAISSLQFMKNFANASGMQKKGSIQFHTKRSREGSSPLIFRFDL